jgi:hypothetical protein
MESGRRWRQPTGSRLHSWTARWACQVAAFWLQPVGIQWMLAKHGRTMPFSGPVQASCVYPDTATQFGTKAKASRE